MRRSKWDTLPHHLSNQVTQILVNSFNPYTDPSGALKAILSLRTVSKSWKGAASQYVRSLSVKVQRPADLIHLSSLLPHMSKLHIFGNSGSPLDMLVAMFRPSGPPPAQAGRDLPIDISPLPMSLVDLRMEDCQFNPASFEHFSAANLTSLDLANVKISAADKPSAAAIFAQATGNNLGYGSSLAKIAICL